MPKLSRVKNLLPVKSNLRLITKAWIIWSSIALTLAGCESIKDFSTQLPKLDTLTKKQQTPPVKSQSPSVARIETEVFQQINQVRQQNGLKPLKHNEKLAGVARKYSRKMAEKNFFSHTSPDDGSTASKRVHAAGITYWALGENLFRSKNIAQPTTIAVEGWMKSPGHRENILRPIYAETGIGVWQQGKSYYITQLFMRSPPSPMDLFQGSFEF